MKASFSKAKNRAFLLKEKAEASVPKEVEKAETNFFKQRKGESFLLKEKRKACCFGGAKEDSLFKQKKKASLLKESKKGF